MENLVKVLHLQLGQAAAFIVLEVVRMEQARLAAISAMDLLRGRFLSYAKFVVVIHPLILGTPERRLAGMAVMRRTPPYPP